MINALVTGGCGFIGSNFIRFLLDRRKDVKVINVDKLTYAGNPSNLADVVKRHPDRYVFIKADISDKKPVQDVFDAHEINWIVNFAAESHVDRSILGPEVFIQLMRYVADRPGHDRRYAIDNSKIISELGWFPRVSFDEGIAMTIDWYLDNRKWVESIMDGTYMQYYKTQYGGRSDAWE